MKIYMSKMQHFDDGPHTYYIVMYSAELSESFMHARLFYYKDDHEKARARAEGFMEGLTLEQ